MRSFTSAVCLLSRCEITWYNFVASYVTFAKAKCPSSCANQKAGFSGQKGGTRIPMRLSVKDESGGCSGRVEGSASYCMMYHVGGQCVFRSRQDHQCGFCCGGWYVGPDTQYAHVSTTSPRAHCILPTTCLLHSLHITHTD